MDIIIIGAGGVGREVALIIEQINARTPKWNILGIVDDNESMWGKVVNGYVVLGGLSYLDRYRNNGDITHINKPNIVVAIANYRVKKNIVDKLNDDFDFATIIHPDVFINESISIGAGTIIYPGVIMTTNITIGDHVIVSPKCGIGHDSIIKDYASLLWNVNISGNDLIEEGVLIGSGATVIQGKTVGQGSIIGAGAVVVKDVLSNTTNVGVPSKIIKKKEINDTSIVKLEENNEKDKSKENMKKVLYITTVSRTVNAFLIPHIEMLLENGYSVDIACSIDKEIDKGLIEKGVRVFEVPFSRSPLSIGNFKAFKELIKIQKENQYGIVHVHTPIASIFGRLLKVKFPKLKTIYTAHGYHFLKGGSKAGWLLYYPIEKVMAKFTDVTININSEDYEITKSKLKPKKSYLVKGVGLDLNSYKTLSYEEQKRKKQELNIKDEDFVVIMIAELNENKNQIQLIKAIELLKEDCPRLKVMFVGEGDKLNELKQEALARGVRDKVLFLGFRNDVNELINISDIGTLLSYREGLPRNIMELMANGKKVIATDIRGCRDLVCNENVGQLVKVGDFEATARVIKEYYYRKEIMLEVAATYESSDEEVVREIEPYDVVNVNKELIEIYNSLISKGTGVKRCLHILPMNKLSGAEKMALILCKNMKEYEPVVVCGGDNLKNVFEEAGIKSYALNFSNKKLPSTLSGLKRIIKENHIKILHAHDNNASLNAYLVKKLYRLDVKVISHIHNCYPWLKGDNLNKKIDKFLRTKYDHNIACGKIVYDFYKENAEYFEEEKTSILSNAMDIEEITKVDLSKSEEVIKEFNIPKDKTILGFIGRLDEQKGIIPFIKEFAKHKEEFNDCRILLVGNGSQEDEVKKFIKELALEELFILTGFQNDVYKFYPIIDVFFLPSLYEGLPMVLLEAMAFKKPVVSMDVGSISEVIKNGQTGSLIESENREEFVKALIQVKYDEKVRSNLGENAFDYINKNYNINKYCNKLNGIYNSIIY